MSTEQLATVPQKEIAAPIQAGERGLTFTSFAEMARFAQTYVNSGLCPKGDTPASVLVKMQHGLEIGLPPAQAVQGICVINGRPCVWGDHALGLVLAHPAFEDINETSEGTGENTVAVCAVKRKGRAAVVRRFSVADAKRAGLWGKAGPWSSYPARMLQHRARGFALRDTFADALKGIGIVEEVRDIHRTEKPIEKARLIIGDEPPAELPPPQIEPADQDGATGEEQNADGEFVWKGDK